MKKYNFGLHFRFRPKTFIFQLFLYLLLSGLAFVYVFPFLYMIITSLMSNSDLVNTSINWVPTALKFENYLIAFNLLKYWTFFKNSVVVTIFPTIGHIISCSLIGYGFARFDFPLKKILFGLVVLSMVVPVQTIIVPQYITYKNFNWLNTYWPVIIPSFFGYGIKGGMFIFIFRQFFMGLPKDLENAAKIDGCGFFMTFIRIVFPLAQSALLVTLVLSVVWHWNDFYETSIFVSRAGLAVLPSQISTLASMVGPEAEELFDVLLLEMGEDVLNDATVMAGTALVIAPILIFFSFAQSKFMEGIERTGITGE